MDRQEFISWFVDNYPPGCVITNPTWHAMKIYARAYPDAHQSVPAPSTGGFRLAPAPWLEHLQKNAGAVFDVVATEGRRRAKAVLGDPNRWPELQPTGGDLQAFRVDRNPIEQDADVGALLEPEPGTTPAPGFSPALVVDQLTAPMLPAVRELVERIAELEADDREEIFQLNDLITDTDVEFARREQPSKAAADAAIIRMALTRAWGAGGEMADRKLRNLNDVVNRRLSAQRLRTAGERNARPGG